MLSLCHKNDVRSVAPPLQCQVTQKCMYNWDYHGIWMDTYRTTYTAATLHSHIFTSSNAFSNVVVKFYGVLSHVPCKCHKIQNRCWFLSNPCRLNVAEKSKWTKREEVTGGWKTLKNERFINLYSYSHIVRMLKWRILTRVVHIAPKVKIRNACKIIVVRKHWYRWENN